MTYEKSFRVNDWRYRNEDDKIITTLFTTEYVGGDPVGSDDIAEVKWFPLKQLSELMAADMTAKEHNIHFAWLLEKYQK